MPKIISYRHAVFLRSDFLILSREFSIEFVFVSNYFVECFWYKADRVFFCFVLPSIVALFSGHVSVCMCAFLLVCVCLSEFRECVCLCLLLVELAIRLFVWNRKINIESIFFIFKTNRIESSFIQQNIRITHTRTHASLNQEIKKLPISIEF